MKKEYRGAQHTKRCSKYTVPFRCSLTEAEYDQLKRIAEGDKTNLSAAIRQLIKKETQRRDKN